MNFGPAITVGHVTLSTDIEAALERYRRDGGDPFGGISVLLGFAIGSLSKASGRVMPSAEDYERLALSLMREIASLPEAPR